MKRPLCTLSLLFSLIAAAAAAPAPTPDKLVPDDALAVFTITDAAKARSASGQWATIQLWKDPAMKPFRDKLVTKLKTEVIEPLEKELGLKFADSADLAQGQLTLAVVGGSAAAAPNVVLIMDAREKADALKAKVAEVKKKWVDAGKQIKTEQIRDVEFTTLIFSRGDITKFLEGAFPGMGPGRGARRDASSQKIDLMMGQSGSLLLVGTSAKDIEKVLMRQAGGTLPSLSEQPLFAASYNAMFRESLAYGWVNLKTILDNVLKKMPRADEDAQEPANPAMPRPDKIFAALGLTGLQSLSLSMRDEPDGTLAQVQLAIPESARKGLFKILAFDAKDASPPPFVPADAVKYSRVRIDLPKSWQALENAVVEALPQMAGVIKLLVDNAGKDKDPDFDLRKNLIANLGDDIISYEKLPRNQTLKDLASPPTLVLVGSPKADQLASAVRALSSMFPQRSNKVKEREFLGRTVYSMSFSLPSMDGQPATDRTLNYAASGSYVVFSYDQSMLEEYLRNSGTAPKTLREMPGLAQASQKVGGMGTGLFGYENQVESTRAALEILKKESGSLANLFGGAPMAARFGLGDDKKLREWLDFSLLPPFEQISKYFAFNVFAASTTPDGISLKAFGPVPPQMKK
jgi:hypothetical protein